MAPRVADDVISNLKSLKRALKAAPEFARVAAGAATRRMDSDTFTALGQEFAAPRRPYRTDQTRCPVSVVTPPDGHFMTTFFDVEPISPSGRFLAVTRVPFIWRIPYAGDAAQIVVIDLEEQTARAVYTTRCWGAQLGANVQWGKDDDTLLCNDVVDGVATGVRIDRISGGVTPLGGPVYGLSPDKSFSLSGRLDHINAGIPGYGVPERLFRRSRQRVPESDADGIWRTDLETGKAELFLSIRELVAGLPEQEHIKGGTYYVFNVKVNKQNSRGFAVLFTKHTPKRAGWPPQLVTFDLSGENIRLAIPDRLWRMGGHHPSWLPDGDHIIMNLRERGEPMRFVRFKYDGSGMETLAPGHVGGGHPSLNPQTTHLLTDAYTSEKFLDENGDVPIRCIDLSRGEDEPLCKVFTGKLDGYRRVDPHPVWSGDGSRVVFNGLVDDRRQVMIADTAFLDAGV